MWSSVCFEKLALISSQYLLLRKAFSNCRRAYCNGGYCLLGTSLFVWKHTTLRKYCFTGPTMVNHPLLCSTAALLTLSSNWVWCRRFLLLPCFVYKLYDEYWTLYLVCYTCCWINTISIVQLMNAWIVFLYLNRLDYWQYFLCSLDFKYLIVFGFKLTSENYTK